MGIQLITASFSVPDTIEATAMIPRPAAKKYAGVSFLFAAGEAGSSSAISAERAATSFLSSVVAVNHTAEPAQSREPESMKTACQSSLSMK